MIADPDRSPIDAKVISQEDSELSIVLTARQVRQAVVDARYALYNCVYIDTQNQGFTSNPKLSDMIIPTNRISNIVHHIIDLYGF